MISLVFDNFIISRKRNKFTLSCQAHFFTFWKEDGRHLLYLSLLDTERQEFKTGIRYHMPEYIIWEYKKDYTLVQILTLFTFSKEWFCIL